VHLALNLNHVKILKIHNVFAYYDFKKIKNKNKNVYLFCLYYSGMKYIYYKKIYKCVLKN